MIPVGSGSTAAMELMQKILGTYIPPKTLDNFKNIITKNELKDKMREKKELPLVLLTAYEHHSNEITWRE